MYTPAKNEQLFEVHPIGVRYTCELCGEGEMRATTADPVSPIGGGAPLYAHMCTKCNGTMLLPKTYPYIEWNAD